MSEFQPLVLVVALGAVIAAFFFWRKSQAMESDLTDARGAAEQADKAKKEALAETKRKAEELDKARNQARESKNKLERLKKERHEAKQQAAPKAQEDLPQDPGGASAVRIADSALEASFREKRTAYEKRIDDLKKRVSDLQDKEQKRKAETERAAQRLMAQAGAEEDELSSGPVSAEASVEALTQQLQALQRAATQRERELSRSLKKAESDARAASRRASGHQANYQVIKGQLEMVEDRLAEVRRKYEGAKRPSELRNLPEAEGEAPATEPTTAEPVAATEAEP
ncbi:MAG: hypothetical protein AAF851_06995 [Myxococcota bacterium]